MESKFIILLIITVVILAYVFMQKSESMDNIDKPVNLVINSNGTNYGFVPWSLLKKEVQDSLDKIQDVKSHTKKEQLIFLVQVDQITNVATNVMQGILDDRIGKMTIAPYIDNNKVSESALSADRMSHYARYDPDIAITIIKDKEIFMFVTNQENNLVEKKYYLNPVASVVVSNNSVVIYTLNYIVSDKLANIIINQ